MKIKYLVAAALSLGLAGAVTTFGQPVNAAAKSKRMTYYKTMPKALRGTWQEKSYSKYKKGIKVRWTYTFKKNSYSMRMDFKGGHKKSKTIHFSKKEIGGMNYDRRYKEYNVFPGGSSIPKSKLPYAAYLTFTAGRHNGKKALGQHAIADDRIIYFYRK
ncbi:hypothetical protein FD13_GL001647 [Levilactobacillus senmaizukei DSM 21775 = NBRC 103853]|uniref:Uncharacterized protein n=1 Tax=Levilactobacillus senmaizukei DSM 21775 = NBRC 103853 TaxID=1423803 RepID=A0A0R2DF46_9LACO|nr:hypothetical protein [Levilactobacillus senmaizukei]KRN02656.1 hypothetical protein FD13_GL001647 [Levilactobacillus senmaizukei DSM 21775 = NBRC 103853]